MKPYDAEHVFNVALVSHGGAGKTSLTEAMLFRSGAITRLGSVEEGNTTSDFDPDEVKRGMSVSLSVAPAEWQNSKVNLLDTPGYADFFGEVVQAARVADGGIVVIDGVSGAQVGTEQVWRALDERNLPRLVVINKLDRENSNYDRILDQLRERYGKQVVPLTVPIGHENTFRGVIDLLHRTAYLGGTSGAADVPDDAHEVMDTHREALVEAICELDDDLINLYLEGEDVSADQLQAVLARSVRSGDLIPVLAASATRQLGLDCILDAIVSLLPSAAVGAQEAESAGGRLAALAFKTISDPYIGRLTYVRVFSGTLAGDSHVWNGAKARDERITQLMFIRGKNQEPTQRIGLGDIGVIPKLEASTGDTLTVRENPVTLERLTFPDTAYAASIHPKTRNDVDKLSTALGRITEEDPTLRVHRDDSTGETIMSGLGESHIQIAAERLARKYGVNVDIGLPKVAYMETVTSASKAEGRHVRQSGGHGQYGVCNLEIEPTERGAGFEFVDKIVGGVVPKQFIPAIEKGVREAMEHGNLAGCPVVDVRVSLVFGKYHPVDSSEAAFKMAGSIGFKAAFDDARPCLLEPVMQVSVTVPDEFTGDIIGDLNGKRARVQGMNPAGGFTTVEAAVPQAEMLRYATELRSMTQGRGMFTMKFSHYEEVPAHAAQKVIEERKKDVVAARA
ncbi:MAG: elongation factor G [Chloroflexi bacterium]|nr:elongation factor G [Chloroflexota bacterium]